MLYCALASDYDGTLATDGRVDAATMQALEQFKATGKKLILATGRELRDLRAVFEGVRLFNVVIAENGAVLYFPATQEERALAAPPPEEFVAALRAKGVDPLSVGRSVVATWTPNEGMVLDAIRELGLDWQLTFNKGAVMCLPPGINKASGLRAALEDLKLSPHNVVGIGDAENDQAFLSACGCSVAVANALQAVKDTADLKTTASRGAGVAELITGWLSDPAAIFSGVRKHDIRLGEDIEEGITVSLPSDRGAVLIAGASGVGKTTLTHLLIERMAAGGYQFCIVDPEGDYDDLEHVIHLGDGSRTPSPEDVLSVLDAPRASVAVNLLGIDVPERPVYFSKLMGQISGLRAGTGRPHWLILDETHHLAPNTQDSEHTSLPDNLSSAVFITTRPRNLSRSALRSVGTIVGVGGEAAERPGRIQPVHRQAATRCADTRAPGGGGAGLGPELQSETSCSHGWKGQTHASSPHPQIRRGPSGGGQELLFSGRDRRAQSKGLQSCDILAARLGCGRGNLALPLEAGRLHSVVSR